MKGAINTQIVTALKRSIDFIDGIQTNTDGNPL
jgi:hypothetical protein